MSSGHTHPVSIGSAEVDKAMSDPAVKANLAKPYQLNRNYDLPYLAGYSQDGATIYIDRHLPKELRINGRLVDPTPFLETHEHTEKSIIDGLGWKYAAAHEVATAMERRRVLEAGINWQAYSAALKPLIKADEGEKIEHTPPDLDLSPYQGDAALLKQIEGARSASTIPAG